MKEISSSIVFMYIYVLCYCAASESVSVCTLENMTWSQVSDGICPLFESDLVIENSGVDVACYDCPVTITGSLIIRDNVKPFSVIGFDELEVVKGDLILQNNAVDRIEGFSSLIHVYGDLIIQNNPNLVALSEIPLITVQGSLILQNNPGINITTQIPFLKCVGSLIIDEDVHELDSLVYVDQYECCLLWCLSYNWDRSTDCPILCQKITETVDDTSFSSVLSDTSEESISTIVEEISETVGLLTSDQENAYLSGSETEFNANALSTSDQENAYLSGSETEFNANALSTSDQEFRSETEFDAISTDEDMESSSDDFNPSENVPPTSWLSDLDHVEISATGRELIWGEDTTLEIRFSKLIEIELDYITTENDLSLNAFSMIFTDKFTLDESGTNVTMLTLGTTILSLQGVTYPLLFEILIYQEDGSVKLGDTIFNVEKGDIKITSVIEQWVFLSLNSSLEICIELSSNQDLSIMDESIDIEDVGTFTWSPTCTAICGRLVEREVKNRYETSEDGNTELCFGYSNPDKKEIMHLRHEQLLISSQTNNQIVVSASMLILLSTLLL